VFRGVDDSISDIPGHIPSHSQADIAVPTKQRAPQHVGSKCHGQKLNIGNRSPWTSYPFGLHAHVTLPWKVFIGENELLIVSVDCIGQTAGGETACQKCAALLQHRVVGGILERLELGPHDNIQWQYLTVENLVELLDRKTRQINALKLGRLNLERSLTLRARHLDAFKRFLFAVAKGDIPRLHSLVDTMLANGASIFAILEKIDMACSQVYSPKNYSEVDYERLFLFHKLGGVAVAELAHRTLGLPSIETTRHHVRVQPLHPSPKMPTSSEMALNLAICFPPKSPSGTAHIPSDATVRHAGFQLMADEIKIESRLRWDARTNMILGVCREHSADYAVEFKTIAQPDAILRGINENKIHFATEVCNLCFLSYPCETDFRVMYTRQQFLPSHTSQTSLEHILLAPL